MFTRIEARRFRSLKGVDQELGRFRALVGPNGSGKTTFLDVIAFLSDLVRNRGDVRETVRVRSVTFEKLLWMGEGNNFQLAVEAEIPDSVKHTMAEDKRHFPRVRYEVEVALDEANEVGIEHETLWLTDATNGHTGQKRLEFPKPRELKSSLLEKLKTAHRASLAEMDALFASLQLQAFRGEL